MPLSIPPVALFGYHSSVFTQKIRLALRLRQVPYTFVIVPSMMPRPLLVDNFNLTYRKIPVLAIGKDLYIDTSLILETLHASPLFAGFPTLHQDAQSRALTRLLSSHYTDRPLFRLTTGLIPGVVWRTRFGTDRSELIGHKLDADKLEKKVPQNLAAMDTYLSILEPLFAEKRGRGWFLDTDKPGAADLSLYYQFEWGEKISRGVGVGDLTAGEADDGDSAGMRAVFNKERYPGLLDWFDRFTEYVKSLPSTETVVERDDEAKVAEVMAGLDGASVMGEIPMLPTPAARLADVDEKNGLKIGARVSIAPDDTGRDDPTVGRVLALSPEEVVIKADAVEGVDAKVKDIRLHFPRVGFVVRPVKTPQASL